MQKHIIARYSEIQLVIPPPPPAPPEMGKAVTETRRQPPFSEPTPGKGEGSRRTGTQGSAQTCVESSSPLLGSPHSCRARGLQGQLGGRPSQDSAGTAERRRRKTNLKRPKARLVRRGLVSYLGSIQQSATNHSILMQLSSKQIT